ncbi:MAG: DUF58 domain-containing protein [Nitrospinales bacterium]
MFETFIYKSYSFTISFKNWVLTRFTKGGLFILGCLPVTIVLGVTPDKTLGYQIFSLLLSFLLLSILFSKFYRADFSIERSLPQCMTVGEKVFYQLKIKNNSKFTQKGLLAIEDLEDPRPSFDEFISEEEPGENKRNAWDRRMKYYRWMWLVELKEMAETKETKLPTLPPEKEISIQMELMPIRRGYLRFAGSNICRPDPFGLFKSIFSFTNEESLLVLPKIYMIPALQLPGRRKHNEQGVALASHVGDSEEFVSLRDYRAGDPMRNIHWKSWAKMDKPIVKEFQEEYFSRHALVLDTFASSDVMDLFEEAVSAAASFVSNVELKDSLLDFMFVGNSSYCLTAGRSLGHTDQFLEVLASVKVCNNQPFSSLATILLSRVDLVNGCVCIFLQWDEERINLVSKLKLQGISLVVLLITENKYEFENSGFDPGPMKNDMDNFHILEIGNMEEGLSKL